MRALCKTAQGKTEVWMRTVETASGLEFGEPRKLFDGCYLPSDDGGQSYDISRDGKRFLMVRMEKDFEQISEFIVVRNWFEELEDLVPVE